MAKLTLQEKFVKALLLKGEKEVKRTGRYIVFSRSFVCNPSNLKYFYLGSNGALRTGNNVANSFPMPIFFKNELIALADAN